MTRLAKLFGYSGGIHPAGHKQLAANIAIEAMALPDLLTVSMSQHLGAPAKPTVKKGDTVARGQRIGDAAGFISAHVHAPTSGTVTALVEAPTAIGGMAPAVVIEPDGEDCWDASIEACPAWRSLDRKALLGRVAEGGVAGMGGAGFPTHVKLGPPPDKTIDTLVINGAECEPYLTADYRLMLEQADDIAEGIDVIRTVLGAGRVVFAIEDNKPEAILVLERALAALDGDVQLAVMETKYPQGAEKQQILTVTGREVPSGGLPMDVGVVVENVSTAIAVRDAVVRGLPLIERVTTVTGSLVNSPRNLRTRLGASYAHLLGLAGGTSATPAKVISGGPMMGFAQASLETATTKTTSGILLLSAAEVVPYSSLACISCGRCVDACPIQLVPSELSQMLEAEDYENAEAWNVMDCIECGCCSFSCPAHRPLVQHMRRGKNEIMLKRRAAAKK
jgi:electron transport complex protein RnfC